MLALGVSAACAVLICPLPIIIQHPLLGVLCALLFHQWRSSRDMCTLTHQGGPDDTHNHWTISGNRHGTVQGQLIKAGYRSAALLVLVIQDDKDSSRHRVAVWSDSLPSMQFSYLNLQLMFNTRADRS